MKHNTTQRYLNQICLSAKQKCGKVENENKITLSKMKNKRFYSTN